MRIKKIVVGCDFSPESEVAVAQALRIARHVGAELVLAHVGAVPDRFAEQPRGTQAEYVELAEQYLAENREKLEQLRQRVSGQGAPVSHVVYDGYADTGLGELAAEMGADLVLVGTHGRTGVKRFLLGSVAERVVRLSPTSVMVARGKEAGEGGFRRILVPTDFSAGADKALDAACSLVASGGKIDLLHCWHLPAGAASYYGAAPATRADLTELRESVVSAAQAHADRLLERHRDAPGTIEFHLVEGAPSQRIAEQLETGAYDLVSMGSHGRRGLRRFLVGSVAEVTVRHSPCSVLAVH